MAAEWHIERSVIDPQRIGHLGQSAEEFAEKRAQPCGQPRRRGREGRLSAELLGDGATVQRAGGVVAVAECVRGHATWRGADTCHVSLEGGVGWHQDEQDCAARE